MYKISACFIAFLFSAFMLRAQSVDSLVAEGLRLEKNMQEAQALEKYKAALALDSADQQALCRASILSSREGGRQVSAKAKAAWLDAAKTFAERALRENPDKKEANLAMALALRQLSLRAGAKEKAGYMKEVKIYADKALLIDSAYAPAWHVLGNWNYDVSSLNFAERAATKLLFGGLPAASMKEAIADYKKCRRLDPSYILNIYDLAKAYHANSEDLKAIAVLKQALRLRPVLRDDRQIQDDCRKMIRALE